jgi:hypothetical protein
VAVEEVVGEAEKIRMGLGAGAKSENLSHAGFL